MIKPYAAALAAIACLGLAAQACGQTPAPAAAAPPMTPPPPNDYGDKANWLCWPGRADACASDLTATVIKADGTTSIEAFKADPAAPIDCFYVYPTVSTDPGVFSTMKVEPAETNVVIQQAARLTAKCRLYAPMYRQFTLTALVAAMTGGVPPTGGAGAPRPMVPLNDVRDAWNYYLTHENRGRGVVLVGHSQGSSVLAQLIKSDIDGKDSQKLLVSAILMGVPLVVPAGADVGGDFKSIPLCRSQSQTGCAIAYSSFRDNSPPPDNSKFGRPWTRTADMAAACVNPANPAGGWGEAKAYFGSSISAVGSPAKPFPWLKDKTIATPFVAVPGLIKAECVSTPQFNYLAIHINADPASPRASDIPGDIVIGPQILKDWGLHLVDANLFMGNLEDVVGAEAKTWSAKTSH